MIKQILTQLENKTITVKLKDDDTFSSDFDIQLDDFLICINLEVQACFSAPEPTTLEHYYPGGDLEHCDIEIDDVTVYDCNGDDEISLDKVQVLAIKEKIEHNIEFS